VVGLHRSVRSSHKACDHRTSAAIIARSVRCRAISHGGAMMETSVYFIPLLSTSVRAILDTKIMSEVVRALVLSSGFTGAQHAVIAQI